MVNLDDYPDDVILKAFWLQRHIQKHGIEGIHFMGRAENEAESGDSTVATHVSSELNKL